MSALSIEALKARFGTVEVLKGLDLDIDSGEFIVLVGPSGCGKSTLLNIIAGLEKPSEGRIEIGGRDVTRLAPKDRDIAMVFQSYALYPAMSVRKNISFGMECRGVAKPEQHAAFERVEQVLRIGHLAARRPGQLSGGQRQRVAMGRALVRDPLLFLFDEPLSNLDAKLRVEMRMEIKRLHQRVATTMVYVTHDQIEAMTLATRIAVMNEGEIQQFADPQTIYDEPANLFVARFMGSPPMNTLPVKLEVEAGRLYARVLDDDKTLARLPLPQRAEDVSTYVGQAALLGIRPERIALGGHGSNRITALVEMTELTGAETMAFLDIAGTKIVARIAAESRPALGERAEFSFDMRKACLFDSATERRIA
jgi:multiple sugar transport system ATP-binding protein